MPLTTQYVELLSEKDPYLRYDQYRGSDSQEHKAKLAKEAASVEREASKKEIILDLSTANLDPEPHWCEAIIVKIQVGSELDAGRIVAYQIRRSHLRWNSKPFQYFLDVPGQESCNIGNALFDRHGRLKPHLYGNFGAETDQGEVLYIRDIRMKPKFRQKGLACLALKYLMRKLSQCQEDHSHPSQWWFAVMHKESCEESWRSAGFRVLNRTCFLACCAQKGHKCWDQTQPDPTPLIEDVQPPTSALDKALLELVLASDFNNSATKIEKAVKLLRAGADMQSSMAVQSAVMAGRMQAVTWLLGQGADVDQQDSAGNTALHFAAHTGQPALVKQLLSMPATRTIKTKAGFTPLDVCILEMQYWREYQDAQVQGGFKGHDVKYMEVINHLLKTGIKLQRVTSLPVPKNKWGCTCGECLNGYLSPHMRYRLQCLAEVSYDNGMEFMESIRKWPANLKPERRSVDGLWLQDYLPDTLLHNVSKSFARGWSSLMDMFDDMLIKDIVPTATAAKQNIERVIAFGTIGRDSNPKDIIAYMKQGGRVEYALDALIGRSREENELTGDGSFTDSMVKEEMDEMKACENDDDYTFLLRQLCNDGYMPSGPHLKRDPENNEWQRASSTRVVHNPPADSGQYD
ncbi:hypothetical protein WJX82_009247 [Trebouxia sp. C0006]